jgi:hypothetical protein
MINQQWIRFHTDLNKDHLDLIKKLWKNKLYSMSDIARECKKLGHGIPYSHVIKEAGLKMGLKPRTKHTTKKIGVTITPNKYGMRS